MRQRDVEPIRRTGQRKLKNRHNQRVVLFHKRASARSSVVEAMMTRSRSTDPQLTARRRPAASFIDPQCEEERRQQTAEISARQIFQYLRELAKTKGIAANVRASLWRGTGPPFLASSSSARSRSTFPPPEHSFFQDNQTATW